MLVLQGLTVQQKSQTFKQTSTTTKEVMDWRYEPRLMGIQGTTKPGRRGLQGIKARHRTITGERTF